MMGEKVHCHPLPLIPSNGDGPAIESAILGSALDSFDFPQVREGGGEREREKMD